MFGPDELDVKTKTKKKEKTDVDVEFMPNRTNSNVLAGRVF